MPIRAILAFLLLSLPLSARPPVNAGCGFRPIQPIYNCGWRNWGGWSGWGGFWGTSLQISYGNPFPRFNSGFSNTAPFFTGPTPVTIVPAPIRMDTPLTTPLTTFEGVRFRWRP